MAEDITATKAKEVAVEAITEAKVSDKEEAGTVDAVVVVMVVAVATMENNITTNNHTHKTKDRLMFRKRGRPWSITTFRWSRTAAAGVTGTVMGAKGPIILLLITTMGMAGDWPAPNTQRR